MSAKRVILTGGKGRIGSILTRSPVPGFEFATVDMPEFDLKLLHDCEKAVAGADYIVHLAWNSNDENWMSAHTDPNNTRMWANILIASEKVARAEKKTKRLIMAPSVHINKYREWKFPVPISTNTTIESASNLTREERRAGLLRSNNPYCSDSPYGEHKLHLEKVAKRWVDVKSFGERRDEKSKLEIICVRMGGVVGTDEQPWDDIPFAGLSHSDLASMIHCCLLTEKVPDDFAVFYAVSKNKNSVHDTSNPFGWEPKDDAATFYGIAEGTEGFMFGVPPSP